MFTLNLLGPVSAAIDGNQFTRFGTSRGQALLIYLALERERAHQREAIMHLLWPDMPLKSAQGNLRQTLYLLRKGFQEKGVDVSPILSTRQTVQIRPDFPLAVDVHEFEMGTGGGTPEKEQEAADLYRGPFLSDFFLPDSEPFEAWAAEKRATYGRLALDNLDRLAAHHLYGTEYAAAETAARRALALDDLYEPAHRYLMQALAGDGKRGDALTHYDSFARQLGEELAVEPDESTKEVIDAIRHGRPAALIPAPGKIETSQSPHPKSNSLARTCPRRQSHSSAVRRSSRNWMASSPALKPVS